MRVRFPLRAFYLTMGVNMKIGIVGHEAAKFTKSGEQQARKIIYNLLDNNREATLVSGHCHLGGIDIWAEEIADMLGIAKIIFPPRTFVWSTGYKPRNIQIANTSDIVHCIVVNKLPLSYKGMRFTSCYHCGTKEHIKSGGCWTAKRAKQAQWHIINQEVECTPIV